MKDRKRVTFHYDSEPYGQKNKLTMTFKNNLIVTNSGQTATVGPQIDVLRYGSNAVPLVDAKECLEEMLALVNVAMGVD